MGITGIVSLFFDLGDRWEWVAKSTYHNRKLPVMPCRLVLVGPRAGVDRCVISRAQRDFIR